MKIRRYRPADAEPIARLNERLRGGGISDCVYPEGAEQFRKGAIRERLFVAEDGAEIRGAVWLKEQPFRVRGEDVHCGWLKYPVAESLIDARFNSVPASLIVQCLREQPRLFALGLGGHATPLARMLAALRWTGVTVPMLVRLLRPSRCLRQLTPLRATAARRTAADVLAWSGLGWIGVRAAELLARRGARAVSGYSSEECPRLGDWADRVWLTARDTYDFVAGRDSETVESMLPSTLPDVHRLRVRYQGNDVGWVYVVRHDFSIGVPDRNFARLTVGLIADGVASPQHVAGVLQVASEYLESHDVDIAISNQLHPAWVAALERLGYLRAPSNFALYFSPKARALPVNWHESSHMNRGDCDGPLWYQGR